MGEFRSINGTHQRPRRQRGTSNARVGKGVGDGMRRHGGEKFKGDSIHGGLRRKI